MNPTLSIVIPVHNGASTLPAQLDAVLASIDDAMEVLIVENRSTDRSAAIAADYAASSDGRVSVVTASARASEAYARNVGLQSARSEFVAFCDADDVVAPSWPGAMRRALSSAEYVTGPIDVDQLNPEWLADVRGRTIFEDLPVTVGDIPFAHGCNIGVRRSTAEALGGFDEDVRIGTDVDFAIRAHKAGVTLDWADEALVHYRHRTSARERWRQAVSYGRATDHLHELAGVDWRLRTRILAQRRRLAWMIVRSPGLRFKEHRVRWAWTAALVWGELRGRER